MNRAAQGMLRRALAEQMEKEAVMVPSDEIIQKSYRFSENFLRNMECLKQNNSGKDAFLKKQDNIRETKSRVFERCRMYISIAALCACCVIAVGITWQGWMLVDKSSGSDGISMENNMVTDAQDTMIGEGAADTSGSTSDTSESTAEVGWMPFSDLTAQEIAQVEVEIYDKQSANQGIDTESQDESDAEKKERWKGLADILNGLVVSEEIMTDSLQNMQVQYRIQKTDGSDIVISVYEEALIIDDVGYRADVEICRQLILLAEEIQQQERGE